MIQAPGRVGVDHQWQALDGQTVFGQYLVNDDRPPKMLEPFMLFMSGCVFGQIQLCAHVLPRQCLVQLILAMGTVQARNLSSETFQLGAAFFPG